MVTGISDLCPRQLVSLWAVPWQGLCRALPVVPEEVRDIGFEPRSYSREAVFIPEPTNAESGMRAEVGGERWDLQTNAV